MAHDTSDRRCSCGELLACPETPPDLGRLTRAIGATKSIEPGDLVETTEGNVSALDYPEEWFETSRELAGEIINKWADA